MRTAARNRAHRRRMRLLVRQQDRVDRYNKRLRWVLARMYPTVADLRREWEEALYPALLYHLGTTLDYKEDWHA